MKRGQLTCVNLPTVMDVVCVEVSVSTAILRTSVARPSIVKSSSSQMAMAPAPVERVIVVGVATDFVTVRLQYKVFVLNHT